MAVSNHIIISIWCLISASYYMSQAFTIYHKSCKTMPHSSSPSTILKSGVGTASTYTWNEEQFEIEVKLTVPPKTTTKDIKFKCSSQSIDLRLLNCADDDNINDVDGNKGEKILLDGSRQSEYYNDLICFLKLYVWYECSMLVYLLQMLTSYAYKTFSERSNMCGWYILGNRW